MPTAEPPGYRFAPLSHAALPLIRRWLDAPQVRRWYGGPSELSPIARHVGERHVHPHLVLYKSQPIGYLQRYDIGSRAGHPYADLADGAVGIDQFIGPAAFLGRGHGSAFIRAYLDLCRAHGLCRVLTDPHPANARAIAAYRKSGFRPVARRHVPGEGDVQLMMAELRPIGTN